MTTRDTAWPAGTPCWADLATHGIDQAAEFYAALFGWDVQPGSPEFGGYRMCLLDGRAVAGLGAAPGPAGTPPSWITYLATTDADAAGRHVTAAGGTVLLDPLDVADVGRMVLAADPAGASFGLWQAGTHIGTGLTGVPGTVCWNEQLSADFAGSKEFYGRVFGYTFGDLSDGAYRYATLDVDGRPAGGLGGFPPEDPADDPASWLTYFGVPDTYRALAQVVRLGGRVLRPAWDTQYGRMATVADDQGATFAVIALRN